MADSVNQVQPGARVGGAPAPLKTVPAGKGSGEFEALLGKLTREMEGLKPGREASDIRQPEDLEAALSEAGRKFRSCQKLKQNLIEAYRATLKEVQG